MCFQIQSVIMITPEGVTQINTTHDGDIRDADNIVMVTLLRDAHVHKGGLKHHSFHYQNGVFSC